MSNDTKKNAATQRQASRADMPADLLAALRANPAAEAMFDALPPSHRREYVRWINEAKRDSTRLRRIAATVGRLTSDAISATHH